MLYIIHCIVYNNLLILWYYCDHIYLFISYLIQRLIYLSTVVVDQVVFARFLTVKFFSPLPHCPLWMGVALCSPHLRSGELGLLHKWLRVLLHGKFVYSFLLIYIQLFTYINIYFILIYACFIYTLQYNSILLYFFAQMVPTLTTGSSFSWLPDPLIYPHQCRFLLLLFCLCFFWALPYFHSGSSCMSPALGSCISSWSPDSFFLENGNRNQNLGARCAQCYGVAFL